MKCREGKPLRETSAPGKGAPPSTVVSRSECGRKTSPPGIVASSSFPPRREVIVPAPRLPRRRWARPRLLWPLSLLTWKVGTERLLDPSVCVPLLKLRFYSAAGQHVGAPHNAQVRKQNQDLCQPSFPNSEL